MAESERMYRVCRSTLVAMCSIGLSASLYAYYVESKKEADSAYQAACDISETISCSAVFSSKYGRGFGLIEYVVGKHHWLNQPNSIFGMIFYVTQVILDFKFSSSAASLQLVLSVTANLGSIYLAYILAYILNDMCVVCVTTYAVNFMVLLCNIFRRQRLLAIESKSRQRTGVKKVKSS